MHKNIFKEFQIYQNLSVINSITNKFQPKIWFSNHTSDISITDKL